MSAVAGFRTWEVLLALVETVWAVALSWVQPG